MSDYNQAIIAEFRHNNGKVGGPFEGAPLILLTTTGAKTGRRHTSPTMYLRDGDRLLVFASNAGLPNHPAWYHNLLANPQVTVELGDVTYDADAVVLRGEERDRWYARQAELVPAFAEYQERTSRTIPVVALHPGRVVALGDELVRIHDGLRAELDTLRTQLADGRGPTSLGTELTTHCLTFCSALEEHHLNEDRVFPVLEAQLPEFAPAIERMRREHRAVAAMVGELQELLTKLQAGDGDPEPVRAGIEKLAGDLEAHFAYEEAELVPVLNQGALTNRGDDNS
jgi:deazaflavin-dependent oxidoreductase (nitroreductase family)